MKKISISSKVENGKAKSNLNLIRDAFKSFEGKDITITIERKRKKRTNPENRYYFGVVIVLLQEAIKTEWGEVWSKERCHELLKNKFLYFEKVNEETGEILKMPKSTTECSTTEFEDYLSECREFLREWFNCEVPLPNEGIELNFNN